MCLNFNHLHCHTDASPDGLGTIENMVNRAAELDYNALAMTDHGTLSNTIGFSLACKSAGIKPIYGLEAYHGYEGKRYHLTLNSYTPEGYRNLVKLNNAAHVNWVSGFPLLDLDILGSHSVNGIALFSGCPAGAIHDGTDAEAANWLGSMVDIFGSDNVYLEQMFVLNDDFNTRPYEFGKRFNLQTIVTGDVHFSHQKYAKAHQVLTSCRKGYSYDSNNLWLKTPDEIWKAGNRLFDGRLVTKWMDNAFEFSQKVDPWQVDDTVKLPDCSHLRDDFYKKLIKAKYDDLDGRPLAEKEVRERRYTTEMATFEDLEFIDYFVILDDIVGFCHESEIIVGPGRGSGAGSYVLYLLGVTNIDPIDYDLYFERFLNEHREGWPDVDVDIESDRRQEVVDYVNEKWGGIPVAAYSHYSHKVTVNDISRHMKLDQGISKKAAESGVGTKAFEKWCAQNPQVQITYEAMSEQIRHASKHAGGIVITSGDVPVEMVGKKLIAAWTEGSNKELSKAGIIKYDILGLTALSWIREMREKTGVEQGTQIPEDGDKIFKLFREGDVAGIFQWSGSDSIRNLTIEIKPGRFIDLAVINALHRPGALDAGTAELYPKLKGNHRLFEPRIDRILEKTRGVICFQEQVIGIFGLITGKTFAEADIARRVITKLTPTDPKWLKSLADMKNEFFTEGDKNGFDKKLLLQLWEEIYTHTRYSFNMSHSACYSMIACEMAWFKQNFPAQFYASGMNYDPANTQTYIIEALQKDIELLPPNVNTPTSRFEASKDGKAILMPLSLVNFMSEESAQLIVDNFEENGPFNSLEEFANAIPKKKCNKRTKKNLWHVGAFEGVSGDRSDLFEYNTKEKDKGEDKIKPASSEGVFEATGYVIPDAKIANYIARRSKMGDDVAIGFVKDWSARVNKRGKPYKVYYLSPHGSFWLDEKLDVLKKGDLVEVKKNNYGKAIKRKRITLK